MKSRDEHAKDDAEYLCDIYYKFVRSKWVMAFKQWANLK